MVIILRSIHRVEEKKNTFENQKATEMFKYIFCNNFHGICRYDCATWIWFVILSETWFSLCIFTCNVIACFFLWTWSCFSSFSWCVKRPITFMWNCFQKRYRGPSVLFSGLQMNTAKYKSLTAASGLQLSLASFGCVCWPSWPYTFEQFISTFTVLIF